MKTSFTYRQIVAASLAVLLLQAVVLREAHHLLEHHHDVVLHCDSDETHLHSEEYAPEDCFVCFFHFAPAKLELTGFSIHLPFSNAVPSQFFHKNPLTQRVKWHFHQRGPPAFPA